MKYYNKAGYIYSDTSIDWPQIIAGYNRMYATNFRDEKDLYLRISLSPSEVAKRFGVSITTIYNRMDAYGIKRNRKRGGPNNTVRPKYDAFLAVPEKVMADMTAQMLAMRLRAQVSTIYRFAKETGRVFRRRAVNRVKGDVS